MIYIKDTSIASDVYFPRLGAAAQYVGASGYIDTRLELTHTITRQTRTEGGMVEPCGDYLLAEDFTADPKLSAGEWVSLHKIQQMMNIHLRRRCIQP